jgi:hypothetical protein
MVTPASIRLTTVAARTTRKFPAGQNFGTRRLRNELSVAPIRYRVLLCIGGRHMRFVLVNGRTPCPQSCCVLCRRPIGASYLREIETRLSYCDDKCYAEHCEGAVLAIENHARASLTQALGLISAAASNASSARQE